MADRGNGIRIFNSRERLESILEEFEEDSDDQATDDDDEVDTAVVISQLRHFVIQVNEIKLELKHSSSTVGIHLESATIRPQGGFICPWRHKTICTTRS